jgi:hypothetical protein
MPLIWCSISSHGFGHAAQVVPVLNALGHRISGLKAILRTTVPGTFFEGRLQVPWEISPAEQDIGCIQHGPLHIDVGRTWLAHHRFHERWDARIIDEAKVIRELRPDLVLSNISYLAIAAASRTGIPVVGLSSLSWDRVLELFVAGDGSERSSQMETIRLISDAYAQAELMLLLSPGVSSSAFKQVRVIAPVAQAVTADAPALRAAVGASDCEPIVLVAFGGIPFEPLPMDQLQKMLPYRFILDRAGDRHLGRVRSVASLSLPFGGLLASADILLTKPGYSTVVEAVAHDRPVVYVRRYNFADEQGLVEYLHKHGRAVEISKQDFLEGRWRQALASVQHLPSPVHPAPGATGAQEAAAELSRFLV